MFVLLALYGIGLVQPNKRMIEAGFRIRMHNYPIFALDIFTSLAKDIPRAIMTVQTVFF